MESGVEVEVWELVPGDLVLLNSGEKVPGDGMILESVKLALDEAILTGESEAVSKTLEEQVFMGTTVLTGRGQMQVLQTGPATELGKIATSLQEHVEEDTPLQKTIEVFQQDPDLDRGRLHRCDPGDRHDHGRRIPGHAANFHHPGDRGSARRPAHRCDRHPGAGDAQDPQAQRPGQTATGSRDARFGDSHLHRQNRHLN